MHGTFVAPLPNVFLFTDHLSNSYPAFAVIFAAVNVKPYVHVAGALLIVPRESDVQFNVIVFPVHDAFGVFGFCMLLYPSLHDVVQTHWLSITSIEQFTEFAFAVLHGAHCCHCAVNVVGVPVVMFVISAPNATSSPFGFFHPVKIFVPFVISHVVSDEPVNPVVVALV